MTPCRRALCGAAFAVAIGALIEAQDAGPAETVTILVPRENDYVSGSSTARVHLSPQEAVERVVFFVDGRQTCTLTAPPFECHWDAGATIVEHQVRVVATFAGGHRVVSNARTKGLGFAESVDVDVVQVTVTVTDGRGHFVRGLPRSAFHVFEDGRPQSVSHFESEDVPLDLIVALDISGSMTSGLPKLKEAAKEFLAAVPSTNRVTLLGFNDTIFALARNSRDPAERARAIDRLAPWGGTALYDVIIKGVDMLGRQAGRKALIVFTDGEDEGSHATIGEAQHRLEASDATLYMIGQGRGTSLEPLKKIMNELAQPTGGRALFLEKLDELHSAFVELLDELSNQYLLGYVPPGSERDDKLHRIKVDVDGRYNVRARQSYRAAIMTK